MSHKGGGTLILPTALRSPFRHLESPKHISVHPGRPRAVFEVTAVANLPF
jgi:hypothetical protein